MSFRHILLLISAILLLPVIVLAQTDRGGIPRSFSNSHLLSQLIENHVVASPDLKQLKSQDNESARQLKSYRSGITVAAGIIMNEQQIVEKVAGGKIRRYSIKCDGALAIGLIFSKLHLASGADLFVYTHDKQSVAGAFTRNEIVFENDFTIRPLPGNELIVEYFQPEGNNDPFEMVVDQLIYIYRGGGFETEKNLKILKSGSCEVNINCAEGSNWQEKKNAVAKILTKVGSNFFYCTGTLLNNTGQDFQPLMLTANHCSEDGTGGTASVSDMTKWVFYFNYETADCKNTSASQNQTVIGATILASSKNPDEFGSDFMLLKLSSEVPASYKPYYCGWDCSAGGSMSGVCIHHPDGDVKKISTYTTPLVVTTWETTPNTHWLVSWIETPNGRGVTEPGSSGAPLFDDEGLVVGTLTGGESSCSSAIGGDYFGRVAYSWKSNGTTASRQLQPWLDPSNLGIFKMPGTFNNINANADFSADNTVIPVGGIVDFQDLSSGKPTSWHWFFEGGSPKESTDQNPKNISYNSFGSYKVKLIASNAFSTDTLIRRDFIDVRAVVSPNPGAGVVNILADTRNTNDIHIEVFNLLGERLQEFRFSGGLQPTYSFNLPEQGNVFIIRIIHGDQTQTHKVLRVVK